MQPPTSPPSQTTERIKSRTKSRTVFSIKSILVITAVFGASAASLGHLWRAAQGDQGEIGQFVIITAMLPMVMVVAASWFFKIFGRLIK